MHTQRRVALTGLALSALASSVGCGAFSKGPRASSALVAYKMERLTLVSTAGQRCEVDAVTYSIIKVGENFHCKWDGSTKPADKSVTQEEPKSLEPKDPSKPESQSPWWWPFKKSATSSKPGTPPKTRK